MTTPTDLKVAREIVSKWFRRSIETGFDLQDAIAQAISTARQEGYAQARRYIPDIVKNAMLTAWNEICSDTHCHPTDIKRNFEGRKGHIGFEPEHWARLTGEFAAEAIARALSTRAVGHSRLVYDKARRTGPKEGAIMADKVKDPVIELLAIQLYREDPGSDGSVQWLEQDEDDRKFWRAMARGEKPLWPTNKDPEKDQVP